MKTFTIDTETNNITAHPTAQEAQTVAGAERFATQAAFAALAANWSPARLVEIWNTLPGGAVITKFKDRKTAVTRIWNAIQSLGEPIAAQAARKPGVPPVKAKPVRRTTLSEPKPKTTSKGNGARQGSKTGKILDLLKRPGGASLKEIMKSTDWQAHSVRGFLSGTLGKKMSLTVVSSKSADGERSYSIQA
jgi:hypothetical protein